MACPDPPFIKLSMVDKIISLFLYLVLQTDIKQSFVFITSLVLNNVSCLWIFINGEFLYVFFSSLMILEILDLFFVVI